MSTLQIAQKDHYAIIQFNQGKVNAINREFLTEFRAAIDAMAKDDSIGGVILAGQPHYFSAGLDVIEIYHFDYEEIKSFFIDFGMMYIELARFPKPLIAAITGHAPAGGAVIAMTCDYKVMVQGDKYKIGLNEILVNVPLSEDLIRGYAFWLGSGLANKYILQGKLMTPNEALQANFVDELSSMEEVLDKAERQMKTFLNADSDIFRSTKLKLRKDWIDQLGQSGEAAINENLGIWWKPEIREKIGTFVTQLTSR